MLVEMIAAKNALHETANQAYNLAMGLQNIAPPQDSTSLSVKYLVEISLKLKKISDAIDEIITSQAVK